MRKASSFFAEEAIGGFSAGVVGSIVGFPLDSIKTRMQTSKSAGNHSMFSMARQIVGNEGLLGLYRGITPPLLSLSLLNTINFTSYSYFRRDVFGASNGWDIRNALSGLSIGPIAGTVSTVENVIKTQMQLDNIQQKQFKGSLHCLKTLMEVNGPYVVYTGHVVNTVREGVFLATYFFVYEGFREMLCHTAQSTDNDITPHDATVTREWAIDIALSGGLAGSFAWFVSFPLDCIRAGVQGQSLRPDNPKKGALQVAKDLMKQKGIRGLYKGVSPSIVRAFLVSGTRFSAYEGALWLLRGGRDNINEK